MRLSPASVTRALLLAVFSLSACADLPALGNDVCGNGVVDKTNGEDCDSAIDGTLGEGLSCGASDDPAHRCRYVCDPGGGADGPACPVGWGCASDGTCRYASGRFESALGSPYRSDADGLTTGDLDGDGFLDLVGFSALSLSARFGSATGQLNSEIRTYAGASTSSPVLGDLDGDGLSDVVAPVPNGIFVMRGAADRTLDPVAYSPFALPLQFEGGVMILPVSQDAATDFDTPLIFYSARPPGGGSLVLNMQYQQDEPLAPVTTALVTDKKISDIAGRIPVADLDPKVGTLAGSEEFALPIFGAGAIWIYETEQLAAGPHAKIRQAISLASLPVGSRTIESGARFEDVDLDGFLDLMVSAGPDVAVAINNKSGQFGALTIDTRFNELLTDPCNTTVKAPRRWPLAVGDFNDDKKLDVVTESGIFVVDFLNRLCPMAFPSTGAWNEAVSADFNRDGLLDVAAVAEGIRGVEFLVGTGTGIFNTFRVDTTEPPLSLRTADFDGDLITDLSVIERGGGQQTVSILFGDTLGAPSPPVPMGSFTVVSTVEPANLAVSAYAIDYISDLVVVSQEDFLPGSPRSLAFFVGSSERRMLAPFIFASNAGLVEAVVVGKYGVDNTPDVLAVTEKNVWFLQGSAGAQFRPEDVHQLDSAATTIIDEVDLRCSLWVSGDLDADGRDEVIAVDHSHDTSSSCHGNGASPAPRVVVAHVAAAGLQVAIESDLFEVPGELTAPSHVRLVDVDRDGALDLVVTFAGEIDAPIIEQNARVSGSGVAVFWNEAGTFTAASSTVVTGLPAAASPVAADSLNTDLDPERELAILTRAGVFLVDFTAARTLSDTPVLITELRGQGSLQAADMNGDGLEDLVVAVRDNVHVFLSQPHDKEQP